MTVANEDGSIRYASASALRARLEARGIRLIVMRHGQTAANAQAEEGKPALLCGRTETPLTPRGRDQAAAASTELARLLAVGSGAPPLVLASPLSRAWDTAMLSVTPLGLKAEPEDRLKEIHFGRYDGGEVERLRSDLPEFSRNFDTYRGLGCDFRHRFPGGESRLDVVDRVAGLLEELAERHQNQTVVLVCHLETIVALRTALGLGRVRDGKLRADGQDVLNARPMLLLDPNALPGRTA